MSSFESWLVTRSIAALPSGADGMRHLNRAETEPFAVLSMFFSQRRWGLSAFSKVA